MADNDKRMNVWEFLDENAFCAVIAVVCIAGALSGVKCSINVTDKPEQAQESPR